MTRFFITGLAAAVAVAVLSGTGCNSTGIGDPCVPEQEYDPSFLGFDPSEVSVEAKSFQCQTRLCLINHFQGRVSCPYGQGADGKPLALTVACNPSDPSNPAGCCTPGINSPVSGQVNGQYVDAVNMAKVPPQCNSRKADQAVYCSCRCANVNGQTNDGYNYCTCPDGYQCTQLVSSIGTSANQGLTGAYCVKNNSVYDPNVPCTECTPAQRDCGSQQLASAGH